MLLSNRFQYDATRPIHEIKAYLVRRISGAIIRKRQTAEGTRRKRPPFFCQLDDDLPQPHADPAEIAEEKEERQEESQRLWPLFIEALNAFSPRDRLIILYNLQGHKGKAIAEAFKISRGRVSQILGRFKSSLNENP